MVRYFYMWNFWDSIKRCSRTKLFESFAKLKDENKTRIGSKTIRSKEEFLLPIFLFKYIWFESLITNINYILCLLTRELIEYEYENVTGLAKNAKKFYLLRFKWIRWKNESIKILSGNLQTKNVDLMCLKLM